MQIESKIIKLINQQMPKSPLRKSISGEVDSELIQLGNQQYLFTTDDFSKEDLFREYDPFVLGWNLACGSISDIIASGGKPLTYSHSMVISKDWDFSFIKKFSQGVAKVLKKHSISFIGGDLGIADQWRYTASVIGEASERTVNRRGCQSGDSIFITGKIGAGNLDAVYSLTTSNSHHHFQFNNKPNKLNTYHQLFDVISEYASCAIDTSDGVFNALLAIAEINQKGFILNHLPFLPLGLKVAKALDLSALLLFLGECGEYEILFTVNAQDKERLKAELSKRKIEAHELGMIVSQPFIKRVEHKRKIYDLKDYNIKARDYRNVHDYLNAMIQSFVQLGKEK